MNSFLCLLSLKTLKQGNPNLCWSKHAGLPVMHPAQGWSCCCITVEWWKTFPLIRQQQPLLVYSDLILLRRWHRSEQNRLEILCTTWGMGPESSTLAPRTLTPGNTLHPPNPLPKIPLLHPPAASLPRPLHWSRLASTTHWCGDPLPAPAFLPTVCHGQALRIAL